MQDIAILHEGNEKNTNDKELLNLILKDLKLDTNRVKFFDMGSKSNFFNTDYKAYKELLKDVKSEKVAKILFMLDADYIKNDKIYGGYDNTKTKLQKIIKKLKLESTDIFISCDPKTQTGYLESLILASVPEKHKNCITHFLKCSEFEAKESKKAILHQIYKIAYPQAPYDFSHKSFKGLKQKLTNLFN